MIYANCFFHANEAHPIPFAGVGFDKVLEKKRLIEHPELNGVLYCPQIPNYLLVVFFVDVGDDIANMFIGFQILACNINSVIGQHLIDLCQNSGNVIMNVN